MLKWMCASTLLTLPSTEKQGKHSSITRLILWIKHCLSTSASPQKSSSTDQSSLWPSGLRVPGNVQIFRLLPIHWYLQSTSLVPEKVEMACLDCGLSSCRAAKKRSSGTLSAGDQEKGNSGAWPPPASTQPWHVALVHQGFHPQGCPNWA